MNTSLPASIESYLKEAGFSQTEMLILRKLLEENGLTVRELAGKMGKSPGLIDQAMKKLIQKKIVKKESMNGQPKYVIHSLDAVTEWVKADMKRRKEMLERRHEDFETFIATLKVDHKKPDLEHFNGLQGIKQAYNKLLASGGEMLTFTPVYYLAEEDPLRAERVELFRRRQVRKIFQRVLAPDTSLSRRFQSRDMFEYRRTLLLPESELPLTFEKTIVGDTVAYIDLKGENACFIRYPDLAKAERATFEAVWGRKLQEERGTCAVVCPDAVVPLSTRILSRLREFFLSPRSICMLMVFALVSAIITFGLYKKNLELNLQRMREQVIAIATTAALQISTNDLLPLRKHDDYRRPEWAKVVHRLEAIRMQNKDILYVYIFRKSLTGGMLEFVSDSHSLNPLANTDDDPGNDVDMNGDGKIDGSPTGGDYQNWPSQPYPTAPSEAFDAFNGATANKDFYEDQWGKVLSGYAPLRDASGRIIAVLAVDFRASKLDQLNGQTFAAIYIFFGFFLLFLVIRLIAENRFSKKI